MTIKNILYLFLLINIVVASDICAMEQPNGQTVQPSRKPYHSNLPFLLWCGHFKNDESCLNWLPPELIVEIINHIREIQKDQDLLNIRNDRDLLKAVQDNNENEVRLLLNEPYINVNVKDKNGWTSLIWTTRHNNPKIIEMLLDKGANPDIQDNDGNSVLMWAAYYNKQEIVKMLLHKGSNPDIKDNDGDTALHWAVIYNNPIIAQILLDNSANPNIQDKYGWTALHQAEAASAKIVQMLLDKGANPNIQNIDGQTALDLAVKQENQAIIDVIKKAKERSDSTLCIIGQKG